MTTRYPSTSEQLACPLREHDPKHYWSDGSCKCKSAENPAWEDCMQYTVVNEPCTVHYVHRLKPKSGGVWQGLRGPS